MNSKKILIIAEAGVNHNGSIELARQLVDVAADAGADYVKFQTFKAERIVSKDAKKAQYQTENLGDDDSQFSMLKKLEMPEEWHYQLIEYCAEKKIGFLSTAFDEQSVEFLDSTGIDLFKIPSGEITNKPYLELIAQKNKPVIMSTGMATLEEVQQAIDVMIRNNLSREKITILHCNTQYPTPYEDVDLKTMVNLKNSLEIETGYSDHTLGIEISIAAAALGASVIEKHFTISRDLPGPDHKASLESHELKAMITSIRNVEQALKGKGIKSPSKSEIPNINIIRKSLYLKNDLKKGSKIKSEDLITLRPADGISPMLIHHVVGKKLKRNKKAFEVLKKSDLDED